MTSASKLSATHSRVATGGSDFWCTPAVVLDRVRRIGPIGLDPCTGQANPVGAPVFFTEDTDGLTQDWVSWCCDGHRLTFVNPPYSQAKAWAAKVVAQAANGLEVVTLVAARPDSRWFFNLVWDTAQAVCFWRGRLRFVGAPSSAPFPSALTYHGKRPWAFEAAFAVAGKVIRLTDPRAVP